MFRAHARPLMSVAALAVAILSGCASPQEYDGAVHGSSGTTTAVAHETLKGYWWELGEFHTERIRFQGDRPDPVIEQVQFADSNRPRYQFDLKHHSGRTVTVKSGPDANGQIRKASFLKGALYKTVGSIVEADRKVGGFALSPLEKPQDGDLLGTLQTPSGPIEVVYRWQRDKTPGGRLAKMLAGHLWFGEDFRKDGVVIASRRSLQMTIEPGLDLETRMCITALIAVRTSDVLEAQKQASDPSLAVSTARLAASLK